MKRFLTGLLVFPFMLCAVCSGINWTDREDLFNVVGQTAILPNVAINNDGVGVAAWVNNTTPGSATIQARYRPAGGVWGPVTLLSAGLNTVNLFTPAVSVDGNGNALVAWEEYNSPSTTNIAQCAIKPGSGNWIVPAAGAQISTADSNIGGVVGAWDANSNAIVGWSISGGAFQTTTITTQGVASAPVNVSGAVPTSNANLAVNSKGQMLVTWLKSTGVDGEQVEAAFKASGKAWSASLPVSPASDKAQIPTCAIDVNGNGLIAWSIDNGTQQTTLYTSQKAPNASSWTTPILVSTTASNPPLQEVGMDSNGNMSAIWVEHPTSLAIFNQVILVATKVLSDTAWTLGEFISDPMYQVRGCLSFQVDTGNNAVAIWSYDSQNAISYPGGISSSSRPTCNFPYWILPATALSNNGNAPSQCNLSFNNFGSAAAIWATNIVTAGGGSAYGVIQSYSGTLTVNDVTNLQGTQLENDFAIVSEFYNTITWTPSSAPGLKGYYIYENGSLVATLGPNAKSYQAHDQVKGQAVTYNVVAFTTLGAQSAGASVVVN